MDNAQITYLYRCFDREGQLLYAGITDDVNRRLRQHAADKYWWHDVTRVTRMCFQSRTEALWAEWAVITTCHPIYNGVAPVPPAPAQAEPVSEPVRPRGKAHRSRQVIHAFIRERVNAGIGPRQVDEVVAEKFGVSTRTARRLRYQVPDHSTD